MAHLEEEDTGNDEDQESDNPDRIEGVTEEFMVHLARAVKDVQADEKCCYHCSSPGTFHVCDHSLQVGPITNLLGAKVTCVGLGNAYTRPLGYVIIWVQVDGVQGYDEDQIALVILDLSNFAAQIPVILGTPTISRVINVMKEAEIDALAMPWANARVAHLLLVHRMITVEVGDGLKEEPNPDGYDQVMFTQNVETIEPFSSHVVQVKMGRAYTGEHINIMVQALQNRRWLFATGPHCTKHIHQIEARK